MDQNCESHYDGFFYFLDATVAITWHCASRSGNMAGTRKVNLFLLSYFKAGFHITVTAVKLPSTQFAVSKTVAATHNGHCHLCPHSVVGRKLL